MIKWDESLSVGVKLFDDHHKELIKIINSLEEALDNATIGEQIISDTLYWLSDYAGFHFAVEEKTLRDNDYPDLDTQKKEHESFIAKLDGFSKNFLAGADLKISKIHDFLNGWLVNHIKEEDKNYEAFLAKKGIS